MHSKTLAAAIAAALAGLGAGATAAQAQVPINVNSPANAGPGTLRAAINQANANANLSLIEFNLPAAGTVLTPAFDLPAITAPIEIDGYTQPGSSPATAGVAAVPGVLIDAVNTTRALQLNANNSLIRGFAIHDSSGAAAGPDGIQVTGNTNRIEGNHIGTDNAGVGMGFWNLARGVAISGQLNVVGGNDPEEANVISEIDGDGVSIAANRNTVVGNRLGLPYGGGLGNHDNGVSVAGNENQIGKMSTGDRNVIADNNDHGVAIAGNHNTVENNYVGLDETGATGVGNVLDGVNVVGNENLVRGNTVSDNTAGVSLDGTSNTVMSNVLGTDAAITAAVPNTDGVRVVGGNSNLIGGDEESERNFISGNNDSGVEIEAGQNHRVQGNDVGSAALPNGDGVVVESSFNFAEDNLVSGNRDAGVKLDGDAVGPPPILNVVDGNEIAGNEIGVVIEDSHRNAVTGNTISGNLDEGVLIEAFDLPNANENRLTGNTITDNGFSGVRIEDADENLVGQPDQAINTIAHNGRDGVTVETGQDNAVVNNSIYDNDELGIDLAADEVTPNDGLLDPDAGPNGLQNHPIIDGNVLVPVPLPEFPFVIFKSEITWTLRSDATTDYRLEFYLNDTCGGRGEAKQLLATENVTTDANGLAQGSFQVAPVDNKVTATATVTDPNGVVLGATSELSACG